MLFSTNRINKKGAILGSFFKPVLKLPFFPVNIDLHDIIIKKVERNKNIMTICYVHGSRDSTDVDVHYVSDTLPSFGECQRFCSEDPAFKEVMVNKNEEK